VTLFGTDYDTPDGTTVRDYVHILDLADAHRLALEATAPDDPRTAEPLLLNLGSGVGYSVRQILHGAERVIGRSIPHGYADRRGGDPPVLVASIDRAREVLAWDPARSTLEEMIGSAWAERQARGR
jgi:UDP-glucose 4-epimerase